MRAKSLGGAVILAIACGCGGAAETPVRDPSASQASAPKKPAKTAPSYLPAYPLAQAPEGTFGPYMGRSGERALAIWATPTKRGHRWMSLLLDAKGEPQGPVRDAGAAPDIAPRVVVRPMGEGFVATFTYEIDLSSAVSTLVFSASGEPQGDAVLVTHSADPVLYADVVNLDGGAVLLYAVEKGNRAELVAIPLAKDGRPRGSGSVLASDAWAWQPVSVGEMGALGLVITPKREKERSKTSGGGQVAMVRFDHEGRPVGERLLVSAEASAEPDLDVVRLGDRVTFAWTDRRDLDARVFVATADRTGSLVVPPQAATAPRGDQAFLGLVPSVAKAGGDVALLAWEDLAQQTGGLELPSHARAVRLGLLGSDGKLRSRSATLAFAADDYGAPEFAATDDGWAALTLAPACAQNQSCETAELVPTAVRFDRDLAVLSSEPVLIGALGGAPASLAWGLSCGAGHCTALTAGDSAPAPVFAMDLLSRSSGFATAAKLDRTPPSPRAVAWDAIAEGERLADMASTSLSKGSLVAWVTYFAEESLDAKAQVSSAATVFVRALDERGDPKGEPTTISIRAASVGGISVASGSSRDDEACLAWVGHDAGQLQVFATRLGQDGKKLGQQMITRTKGSVADVAVAWAGDGWILAWVDWRDGNGEVYATKLDRSLKRVLPERRLTNASGDASNLQILVRGDEVWVAWADARGEGGAAEPYTRRLGARDLQPLADEVRVARTSFRSRALTLATLGDDPMLGWIEEPDADGVSGTGTPGAKLVRLDARGGSLGLPLSVPLQARPSSLALRCEGHRCRGIASVDANMGELRLDAFTWDGGSTLGPSRQVLKLLGSSSGDATPSLLGDWVFFADDSLRGKSRVRRMRMAWD